MLQVLLLVVCLAAVGCGGRQDTTSSSTPTNTSSQPVATDTAPGPQIPGDVFYSIIDSDVVPGVKRSVDVRLNKAVSDEVLRAIAEAVRAEDSREYERTLITYYLPNMTVGAGAWATSHFNPTLEVQIQGLAAEQERALSGPVNLANRNLIGRWLDERPFVAGPIAIFEEDGLLFIEQTFKDGSNLKYEVVENRSPLGRRFDSSDGSSTGDYWVLGSDGHLQIRDLDGLIATARKMSKSAANNAIEPSAPATR